MLHRIDGQLCRLSEGVQHRSSTEAGRQKARDDMADLLARRREAAVPPRRVPNPEFELRFQEPKAAAISNAQKKKGRKKKKGKKHGGKKKRR